MGLEATILDHRERPFPSLQKVLKHLKHWLLHCLTLDELLLSLTHGALPVCDGEGRVPGQALSVSFIIYTLSSNVRAFLSLSGSLTFFSGFPTFWEDVSTKQQGGDGNNYAPHKFKWHEHEARSYQENSWVPAAARSTCSHPDTSCRAPADSLQQVSY